MDFVPRIHQPESGHGDQPQVATARPTMAELTTELDLPEDLLLLAEQLVADAAHVEAACPTPSPAVAVAPAARRRWPWLAAAAVMFAAGLWVTWPAGKSQRPQLAQATAESELSHKPQTRAAIKHPQESVVTPAGLLEGLSGSEREGVLDVLETESVAQSSLSI